MRSKKYLMYGILVVLVISIGVSYSYFVSKVENKNGELSINSKEINIIFTDTTEISEERITPGWSISKSFSVENKSSDVFNYNIVLEDLINTFETVGNLQYKITSSNGYNMDEYADIPKSKERKDVILEYDIDIEKDVKQEYTIEFIYKNSTEDQSIDMNKELSGVLAITEGSIDPNKKYSVTIELENGTITSANPQESLKKGSLTYTYELNEGYEINDTEVICSGSAKGEINEDNIIIRDIREDQICTISPIKREYTLTMNVMGGTTSPTNVKIKYGEGYDFMITNNEGYTVKDMEVDCHGNAIKNVNGNKITINNIVSDLVCDVNLVELPKIMLIVENGNGNDTKYIDENGKAIFSIIPNDGYILRNADIECSKGANGIMNGNILIIDNINESQTCNVILVYNNFYNVLLADNPIRLKRENFTVTIGENINTLYQIDGNYTENGKNVYYFAGSALNNWIKFGQDSNGFDLYWRIIRTNEDGGIRLLYAGTSPDTQEGFIKDGSIYQFKFNSITIDPLYAGYKYGTSGTLTSNRKNNNNSMIKAIIDNWYSKGIYLKKDGTYTYDNYVSRTAIYCNDRANVNYSLSSNDGFFFAGRYRNDFPSYKCGTNENGELYTGGNGWSKLDKFSKSTSSGGNGQLLYPIGLVTIDELRFARNGASASMSWYNLNSNGNSITNDESWWTMSPFKYNYYRGSKNYEMLVYMNGLGADSVDDLHVVRPVLSLKSCVKWKSGNGSYSTPYEVELDSTCASAVN